MRVCFNHADRSEEHWEKDDCPPPEVGDLVSFDGGPWLEVGRRSYCLSSSNEPEKLTAEYVSVIVVDTSFG
jgi:hypothetical protein